MSNSKSKSKSKSKSHSNTRSKTKNVFRDLTEKDGEILQQMIRDNYKKHHETSMEKAKRELNEKIEQEAIQKEREDFEDLTKVYYTLRKQKQKQNYPGVRKKIVKSLKKFVGLGGKKSKSKTRKHKK